jgi:hypothetical protein
MSKSLFKWKSINLLQEDFSRNYAIASLISPMFWENIHFDVVIMWLFLAWKRRTSANEVVTFRGDTEAEANMS